MCMINRAVKPTNNLFLLLGEKTNKPSQNINTLRVIVHRPTYLLLLFFSSFLLKTISVSILKLMSHLSDSCTSVCLSGHTTCLTRTLSLTKCLSGSGKPPSPGHLDLYRSIACPQPCWACTVTRTLVSHFRETHPPLIPERLPYLTEYAPSDVLSWSALTRIPLGQLGKNPPNP